MIKIILAVLLGLSLIQPSSYQEKLTEAEKIITSEDGDLQLTYDKTYLLTYKTTTIFNPDRNINFSYALYKNSIYVLCESEEGYSLTKYSLAGNKLNEVTLKTYFSNLKIKVINNQLFLVGAIDFMAIEGNDQMEEYLLTYKDLSLGKKDAFLLSLNEDLSCKQFYLYSGYLDEEILDIYIFENKVYLLGIKDALTGGVFGNGGEDKPYFIALLDEEYQVVETLVFNEEVKDFYDYGDYLFVITASAIYKFDKNQNLILSKILTKSCKQAYLSASYLSIIITEEEVTVYQNENLERVAKFECNSDFIKGKYLYLKNSEKYYVYDIVNLSFFYTEVMYDYYDQVQTITGLYGDYVLDYVEYDEYFDQLVFGDYNAKYHYILSDLETILDGVVTIEKYANVTSNATYPIGYHLLFSGKGTLNGKPINQYEMLSMEGQNKLILEGKDGTRVEEIIFNVSSSASLITEGLNTSADYYADANTFSKFMINIENLDYENLGSLYVNNSLYNYHVEEESISFDLEINEGINPFLINYITYYYQDEEIKVPINYFFKVLGINSAFDIGVDIKEDEEALTINLSINEAKNLRSIILKVIDGYGETEYVYPLTYTNINLDNISHGSKYEVYLSSYNQTGSDSYYLICQGTLNENKTLFGIFKVILKDEELKEAALIIYKDGQVDNLEIENYYFSLTNEADYSGILIGLLLGIILSVIIVILRVKKKL